MLWLYYNFAIRVDVQWPGEDRERGDLGGRGAWERIANVADCLRSTPLLLTALAHCLSTSKVWPSTQTKVSLNWMRTILLFFHYSQWLVFTWFQHAEQEKVLPKALWGIFFSSWKEDEPFESRGVGLCCPGFASNCRDWHQDSHTETIDGFSLGK